MHESERKKIASCGLILIMTVDLRCSITHVFGEEDGTATRAADVTKLRPPARLRQTNWRVLHIPVLSECKNGVFKQYFFETFNDFN